ALRRDLRDTGGLLRRGRRRRVDGRARAEDSVLLRAVARRDSRRVVAVRARRADHVLDAVPAARHGAATETPLTSQRCDVLNVLSVDVEEYFHAEIFQMSARHRPACGFESRVEASVDLLLRLLARHGARATFFTLGEVARTHPSVVRSIAALGHEVAC